MRDTQVVRVLDGRRFLTLIELADERANPLTELAATPHLPAVISKCAAGGYPRLEVIDPLGSYGFRW